MRFESDVLTAGGPVVQEVTGFVILEDFRTMRTRVETWATAAQEPPFATCRFGVGCAQRNPLSSTITFESPMGADLKQDPTFFDRADSHIRLANEHGATVSRGRVSASLMYGSARFQAWNAACWADDAASMKANRQEALAYFVDQYRSMLEENLDDYIEKFDEYMQKKSGGGA